MNIFAAAACNDDPINNIRRALTNAMLATVGLTTVDDDKDTIPWYIFLSSIQRSWIRQVSEYGYKIGLIDGLRKHKLSRR